VVSVAAGKTNKPCSLGWWCQYKAISQVKIYPYPLSRQKTGVFKVDSSPCIDGIVNFEDFAELAENWLK